VDLMDEVTQAAKTPLIETILAALESLSWMSVTQACLWVLTGLIAGALLGRMIYRAVKKGGNTGLADLCKRACLWLLGGLGLAMGMERLGMDLGVLLGAAGVASIAFGFAAQTSFSNLISGAFLLGEGAITVGDVITTGGTTGEVLSVDLLSVKLRTFDNRLVRMPNEQLIKSEVTNLSAFPLRRIDIQLVVPPAADLDAVTDLMLSLANRRTDVLHSPSPQVYLGPFAADGIQIQFSFWSQREEMVRVKSAVYRQLRQSLLDAGFHFAAPRRVVGAVEHGAALTLVAATATSLTDQD
jgi:small-conductance mechanosensitive channel